MFRGYLLDARRRVAEADRAAVGDGYRPDGYSPPARDDLKGIPWAGDGLDPLFDDLGEV